MKWRSSACASSTTTTGASSVAPQVYRAGDIDVEGDASAASYFAALATLHGARIMLSNLGTNTRQGDYGFFGLCEKLGARVERSAASTVIEGPRVLDAGFDGARRHDQHARRRAHADDARAVPGDARRASPASPRCA